MVKIVTINILFEMDRWEQRRDLLAAGLKAQQADLIGLQEVKLPEDTSAWLAEQLEMPHVYLIPYQKPNQAQPKYGAAILSRYPFVQQAELDLQGQGRKAQYVQVEVEGKSLILCNGHYFWSPGSSPEREKQIRLLLDWLGKFLPDMPVVAVGDFNASPGTPEISLMQSQFTSAYGAHHGHEPEYTAPTPLWRGWQRMLHYAISNWKRYGRFRHERGTRDYIFFNQYLRVQDCQLILTEPAPNDSTLYPSDHFGLAAQLEFLVDGEIQS
ncbi:endonuclease/exonuclease/phosphatase family protein [Coleofasciculus sp. E1-EBD-02]|uniref:endonuclease/exonuclease/phosphatase family protein n=1 Tax=Coleofasciculus sp. E1-EBD-02 TaxID=3068481 RepID=UPI00330089E1